jgi:hypothetical protein
VSHEGGEGVSVAALREIAVLRELSHHGCL